MSVRIDVWSDFGCPFCFLAAASLERLRKEAEVEIHWHSFQLRPPGAPAMPPEVRAMVEKERQHVAQVARTQYGLELRPGPVGFNTRPAHVGEKYADAQGKGDDFHNAVMKAYWQEARSIDDAEVLKALADKIGLSGDALAVSWEDSAFAAAVDSDRVQAALNGITSVPTLLFAEQYIVVGAQPYQVLKDQVAKIQQGVRLL